MEKISMIEKYKFFIFFMFRKPIERFNPRNRSLARTLKKCCLKNEASFAQIEKIEKEVQQKFSSEIASSIGALL